MSAGFVLSEMMNLVARSARTYEVRVGPPGGDAVVGHVHRGCDEAAFYFEPADSRARLSSGMLRCLAAELDHLNNRTLTCNDPCGIDWRMR